MKEENMGRMEKKKIRGGEGGGRKQSASKNILAQGVRYKSPAHLLVSLPDTETKHTRRQQIYGFQTHQHTEEAL